MENKIKHWENGVRRSFHAIVVSCAIYGLHNAVRYDIIRRNNRVL